jgi:hypothetical protein
MIHVISVLVPYGHTSWYRIQWCGLTHAHAQAMLDTVPDQIIRAIPYSEKPYWHIERARLGNTRTVPLEILVNGYPVAMTEV